MRTPRPEWGVMLFIGNDQHRSYLLRRVGHPDAAHYRPVTIEETGLTRAQYEVAVTLVHDGMLGADALDAARRLA